MTAGTGTGQRRTSLRGLLARQVVLLALALTALLVAAVAGMLLASSEYRAGEVRAIARERAANQILVDLLNAETGSRGYALTGNPIYLDPYTNARARYQSDFAALQSKLSDEPTLQQAARTTNAAAQLWFDESTNLVRLRRDGRFREAIARINSGIAKARIDAFRSAQGRLLAEIERLRVESLSRADRRRTITLVLVGVAAALAMLAVGLISRQLWRRVGGPLALLAAGVRRVARGELSEPVPASENAVRELSILTRSFNEMQDQVVEERENVAAAARREAAQQVERRLFETVQHGLLPARLPAPTGFRVAARYLPAEQGLLIGGDFYDAMLLADGRLAMVVGDVAGHGAAAAARAAGLRFAWRTLVEVSPWPQAVLAGLNSQIGGAEDRAEGRFASMLYALVEPGGVVEIAAAGHPPPLMLDGDGAHELELEGGPIIGVFDRALWPVVRLELAKGSTLIIYTDGLVEARHGSELFGVRRALDVLSSERAIALEARLERVVDAARRHDEKGLRDDVVLLAVERLLEL